MRVVVLGSNGMAGHIVTRYLKEHNYEVVTVARSNADINIDVEKESIADIVKLNPDFVVNCIGLLVKDSEERLDRAIFLNSYFPHLLESMFSKTNTRVIHISTDCVFKGDKGYYKESDIPDETNNYGKTKAFGELNNSKDITFRTSIIGPELKRGTGLLDWAINTTDTINGWENAWWSGITTLKLAECIEQYIQNPKITGIYHLVSNDNRINKYELLHLINRVYGLNKEIQRTNGPKSVNKILMNTRTDAFFSIESYPNQLQNLKRYTENLIYTHK